MAIQHSPVFEGFRGSIDGMLVLKQRYGKTIVTNFPDRSSVIFSERQKQAQKRFSDAVYFARTVIANEQLKKIYTLKASLYNFRSAWNAAIAEYMGDVPLSLKPLKERFDKKIITDDMGEAIHANLFKLISPNYSNSGILSGQPPGRLKTCRKRKRISKTRISNSAINHSLVLLKLLRKGFL